MAKDRNRKFLATCLALCLVSANFSPALPAFGYDSRGVASDTKFIAQDSGEGERDPDDGEQPEASEMDEGSSGSGAPELRGMPNQSGKDENAGESSIDDSRGSPRVPPPQDPLVESGSTPSTSDVTDKVEGIVGKAIEAMGDMAGLKKLEKSIIIVGKLIPGTQDQSAAYTYKKFRKGKKWRVDLESPNKPGQGETKRILAYNGLAGWRSSGTVAEDLSAVRLRQLNDDNERAQTILARFSNPEYKFTLLGPTTFRQIPVYAVQVAHEGDTPTVVYIDKRNFLVDGISYETNDPSETGARKISMEYAEYRPISGTMFPYRQTKYIDDKTASEIIITSMSTTAEIDEAVFDRPQSADKLHLSRAIVVPFDYQQKEILVKGRINSGEEVTFLFDTGASDTIIDRRVAADSFLMKQGQSGLMALNGIIDVNNTVLKRLEIGNVVLNDVDARIANLAGQSSQLGRKIAGIIGTNVMEKAVVRIDFGKPSLTFYDKDSFERPANAAIIPLVQHNAPVVKARINGAEEVLMLADTGAAFNNLPTDIAKKVLQRSSGQETHTTEGSGLDGRRVKLGNVVARTVAVGPHSVSNMNFTYTVAGTGGTKPEAGKVVEAKEGFFQNSSIGILGNPFWENFIVTVDYKFQRLLLEPNPGVRLRGEIGKTLDQGDSKVFVYSDYRAGETAYQRGLLIAANAKDLRNEALLWGRMGNLRRMMAKDLARPEHAKAAYDYFLKAQDLARKAGARDVEGRILADWSLLYMDNGQVQEGRQTINQAIMMAPQDPQVNLDYAIHLSRDQNFIDMQKYLDKALFFDPSNWQALWCQFKLSEKFMDYQKGITTLKEITRYYPWSKLAAAKLVEWQGLLRESKNLPKGTPPGVKPPGALPVVPSIRPGSPQTVPSIRPGSPQSVPSIRPGSSMN
jgi:predicted aspartyl protease